MSKIEKKNNDTVLCYVKYAMIVGSGWKILDREVYNAIMKNWRYAGTIYSGSYGFIFMAE